MKKKVLSLLLVLAMALSMIPMASAAAPSTADYTWYGDGSATTFTISDAEDFLGFLNIVSGSDGQTANNFEGKTVALAADIDMGGLDYPHTGNFNLKGTVTGGDGTSTNHSILNLNLEGLLNGRDAGCFDHLLIKDWTFKAPSTISNPNETIEIPFQFFGEPAALTGSSYADSYRAMRYTDTLVRLNDDAGFTVEVVQYGDNTAQILVYSKTAGTFTYDDNTVLSVTNKAFLDVTGAGYIYRSTYTDLADQAKEFYGTTSVPTTAPADVYVYSWIVNGNRLLAVDSSWTTIDASHELIEADVAAKLTFSNEVQTENIRYTNEFDQAIKNADVNGDGKINLQDKEAVRQMMEGSGSETVAAEATNAADRTQVLTARYDDMLANSQRVALRCDFDRAAGNEKFVDETVEYAVYEGIYLN